MPHKSILMLVVLVLSLVGSLVGVGVWAQTRSDPTAITVAPQVLSGENVGVRVTGPPDQDGKAPGVIVVKINGQWVDVKSSPTVVRR